MRSVCIVGAGPGGLVAAKILLQQGAFEVTIFEQADIIGGIWAFRRNETRNAYLGANTPSNIARDCVVFSDLAWASIGLPAEQLRLYPTAAQIGRYLEAYRARYIPERLLRFGQRVTSAERSSSEGKSRWLITSKSRDGTCHSYEFDLLLNAAGFFAKPKPMHPSLAEKVNVRNIHTSQFRQLDDLFPDKDTNFSDKKILIYGCGNSSGEAAGNIAFQLSSALNSPLSSSRERFKNVQVYHVTPRPVYAIPPYVPLSTECATFGSWSLLFYDLKLQPKGLIRSRSGPLPAEKASARAAGLRGVIGDQRDLGADALIATDNESAPYVAVSEEYAEFVRAGTIRPVAGRLIGLQPQANLEVATATIQTPDGSSKTLSDIVAVVIGTGYSTEPTLSFLGDDVLKAIEYDSTCPRLPILLQQHQTINPAVPELAFVGFYEGPYWGVMEMQARLIAEQWTQPLQVMPNPADESFETLRALRKAIVAAGKDVPQYWFSDYVGYLEEVARELHLERHDAPFTAERDGVASIARYLAPGDDREEAHKTMLDLHQTLQACANGKYRARAAFRAMQGKWKLTRRIESSRPELPSGTFTGTAEFHPRVTTSETADLESLYIETGKFVTSSGFEMTASRRYVYRYAESTDTMSVWFVKPDDGLSVDYLFHDLDFGPVEKGLRCTAHAEHLCRPDYYTTDYTFTFRAVALASFELRHLVKGPNKDYIARAQYTR